MRRENTVKWAQKIEFLVTNIKILNRNVCVMHEQFEEKYHFVVKIIGFGFGFRENEYCVLVLSYWKFAQTMNWNLKVKFSGFISII